MRPAKKLVSILLSLIVVLVVSATCFAMADTSLSADKTIKAQTTMDASMKMSGKDMKKMDMKHPAHPSASPAKGINVGVTEHLGADIPLDTVFTTSDGKVVKLGDLLDKPAIIAPVYFSCPNVCNFLQSRLADVVPQMNMKPGGQFRIISVSFDENDTPKVAAEKKVNYMKAASGKIPADSWIFLTGDKKNIDRLMGAFGFRFTRQGNDFVHPVAVITVSKTGKIIRYLYGTDILPFEMSMSVVEAQKEQPGLSVKKLVAYCFSYDPKGKKYVFDIMKVSGIVVLLVIFIFASYLFFGGKKKN